MDNVKIQNVSPDTMEVMRRLFKGHTEGFCKFGDDGFILPASYRDHADALRQMAVRRNDTWVVTFPRSGTTLVQEMVWLLKNNLDYDAAFKTPLTRRYTFIEYANNLITQLGAFSFMHEQLLQPDLIGLSADEMSHMAEPGYKKVENSPSPRYLKTHLPLSLLPSLLGHSKVVYVARDPRDVALSYYHHNRLIKLHDFVGDFKAFWDLFVEDSVASAPFFAHVNEAWKVRNNPNMLFIFYEDIIKDMPGAIRRVSTFLEKQYSDEEVQKLSVHLGIENFKTNKSVFPDFLRSSSLTNKDAEPFIRKGVAGGWRAHFDADMEQQAREWMQRNLQDTDLCFPHT